MVNTFQHLTMFRIQKPLLKITLCINLTCLLVYKNASFISYFFFRGVAIWQNTNIKSCNFEEIIILFWEFLTPALANSFVLNLSDCKSPQVSRILLSTLADLNNAVVWMVSTRPLCSNSSSPCTNPLFTVPRESITIVITVTFIFHSFSVLWQGLGANPFSLSFVFTLGQPRSQLRKFLFFYLFTNVVYLPPTPPNIPFQRRRKLHIPLARPGKRLCRRACLTIWDKVKIPRCSHKLMNRKRVTCELHDSYFRSMMIKHAIPKTAEVAYSVGQSWEEIEWA